MNFSLEDFSDSRVDEILNGIYEKSVKFKEYYSLEDVEDRILLLSKLLKGNNGDIDNRIELAEIIIWLNIISLNRLYNAKNIEEKPLDKSMRYYDNSHMVFMKVRNDEYIMSKNRFDERSKELFTLDGVKLCVEKYRKVLVIDSDWNIIKRNFEL